MTHNTNTDELIWKEFPMSAVVCAPSGTIIEEIQKFADNHSGTRNGWRLVTKKKNPISCIENPDREHWLFVC